MKAVKDFIFLGSKITIDGDCSHEIKRCLLLGRKAITNLDSILKSRDITWPTNVCLVKAMVFLVAMYGCESWIIKKAEPKNWCFWTVVLEKTLFFFLAFYFFTLQYCIGFAIYWHESTTGVHEFPTLSLSLLNNLFPKRSLWLTKWPVGGGGCQNHWG